MSSATSTGADGLVIVLGALLGAITWNLITWYFGLPSSSSHALIGGLVGSGLAGGASVNWDTIKVKVLIPMVVSPLFGFALAFVLMLTFMWVLKKKNPHVVSRNFRMLQTISAAALALGHGLQDAQKTMGVIFLALVTGGYASTGDDLPLWVVIAAALAISAGTYSGGWRIMRTLGRKIIKLDPPGRLRCRDASPPACSTWRRSTITRRSPRPTPSPPPSWAPAPPAASQR